MSNLENIPHCRIFMENGKYTYKVMHGHGFGRGFPKYRDVALADRFVCELNERREAAVNEAWSDYLLDAVYKATGLTKEQLLSPIESDLEGRPHHLDEVVSLQIEAMRNSEHAGAAMRKIYPRDEEVMTEEEEALKVTFEIPCVRFSHTLKD